MTRSQQPAYRYQVGGTLGANAPYVERQADETLFTQLQRGEFCYVFNCRQMGKSSLRARTMRRLMAEGIGCVNVDLTTIGTQVSTEQWYTDLIESLHDSFTVLLATGQLPGGDDLDLDAWQQQYEVLKQDQTISPVRRLHRYLKELLLSCLPQQTLVIFIDEIDNVLNLDFDASDFFALIRACFNQRADDPDYERLTFALFGVATPAQLIRDVNKTPFNLGKDIVLTGFEFERSRLLAAGLANVVPDPEAVLEQILTWTGGQPFLTQKLCDLIQMGGTAMLTLASGEEAAWVAELVRSHIIDNWENYDNPAHLTTIRDRLLKNERQSGRLLGMYQQILQQGAIATDESEDQTVLCLSGLVVRQDGTLRVYNPIYAQVFNPDWVAQELAQLRPPEYAKAFDAWRSSKGEDKDCLLQEQELLQALKWSADKRLSNEDYQFLAACQDAVRQQLEATLNATKQKTQKQIRIGLGVLAASILGATLAISAAITAAGLRDQAIGAKNEATNVAIGKTKEAAKATQQKEDAIKAKEIAQRQKEVAIAQTKVEQKKTQAAEQQTKNANEQAKVAEQSAQIANQSRQKAEADRQRAESDQRKAQTQAEISRKAADATEVRRKIAQKGVELERKGATLLRLPLYQFRNSETLIAALRLGRDMQALLQQGGGSESNAFPAVSPLLALRTAVNSVIQLTQFQGFFYDFSPDGKLVLTADTNISWLYDLTGKQLVQFKGNVPSFSPDGQLVYTSDGGTTRLFDLTGKDLAQFQGRFSSFSPDGKLALTTEIGTSTNRLYDLTGKQLVLLKGIFRKFSPDGKLILIHNGSKSQSYTLTGQQLAQFQGRGSSFSPDGKLVLTEVNNTSLLYDIAGKQLVQFQGSSPSFSLDGQMVLTSDGGTSRLYNLMGKQLVQFEGSSPSFSPDGKLVVINDLDTSRLYNLAGKQLVQFEGSSPSFSPDGRIIATSYLSITRLYNLTGQQLAQFQGYSPRFSRDGSLVSISDGGVTRMYRVMDKSFQIPLVNKPSARNVSSVDGKLVLIWDNSTPGVYDLRGQQLTQLQGRFPRFFLFGLTVMFSPDNKLVLLGNNTMSMLVDLTSKQLAQFQGSYPVFSPDGKLILTSTLGLGSTTWLYDLTGKQLAQFQGGGFSSFSPDGKRILTDSGLYDLTGKQLVQFEGDSPILSPDGKLILTWAIDKSRLHDPSGVTRRLYDLSGRQLTQLKVHTEISFSPNSQLLLVKDDNLTRLYDLTGKQLTQLQGEASSFSPDGKLVLTQDGNTTRLYNLTGQQLVQFQGGAPRFSPDGKLVLTTFPDEDITRLYDLEGNLLAEYLGSTSTRGIQFKDLRLGFTQDGTQILTLTSDNTLHVWPVDAGLTSDGGLSDLLRRGCAELKNFRHREDVRRMCPQG